jgi:hypothetical protein
MENPMPVKTIQITRGGTSPEAGSVTPEQKAALIKGASELMLDVLGNPMEATFGHHRRGGHRKLELKWSARRAIPSATPRAAWVKPVTSPTV